MSPGLFDSLLNQAGDSLYRIVFYNYAEPFTNSHLLEMITRATARGLGSQVSTNFSFNWDDDFYRRIVESGLEHLIVSLDGADAETYGIYRVNGHFERVIHGLAAVIRWRKALRSRHPLVEWQYIVFEHNRHQVAEARAMARSLGVDRFCLRSDGRARREDWPPEHRHRREWLQRLPRLNSCAWLWGSLVVDWDGKVYPCCYAGPHLLGDLSRQSLAEVWNGPPIQELRRLVRQPAAVRDLLDPYLAPCSHCEMIW